VEEYSSDGPREAMQRLSKLAMLGIVLAVALPCFAATKGKAGRLSGNVRAVSDDKSEITLRKGTIDRIVRVSKSTKFTLQSSEGAKTGSIDDVSENKHLACSGTWDGLRLAATACTISPTTQH
jgi:hypothetical protein